MSIQQPLRATDILHFWDQNEAKWFIKDPAFDSEIVEKFLPLYQQAIAGQLKTWEDEPASFLALIIVLDQFPRNMFRNTPKAFDSDLQALALTKKALSLKFNTLLSKAYQKFLYMPLMHSEVLADQDLSVTLFSHLDDVNSLYSKPSDFQVGVELESNRNVHKVHEDCDDGEDNTPEKLRVKSIQYAKAHRDIIARFGRFPHRNKILGRASTPEEILFLEQPGSSF